jgi:hypothetical protein
MTVTRLRRLYSSITEAKVIDQQAGSLPYLQAGSRKRNKAMQASMSH